MPPSSRSQLARWTAALSSRLGDVAALSAAKASQREWRRWERRDGPRTLMRRSEPSEMGSSSRVGVVMERKKGLDGSVEHFLSTSVPETAVPLEILRSSPPCETDQLEKRKDSGRTRDARGVRSWRRRRQLGGGRDEGCAHATSRSTAGAPSCRPGEP